MFDSEIDWSRHSVESLRLPVSELVGSAELSPAVINLLAGEGFLYAERMALIAELHYRLVAPTEKSDRHAVDAWAELQAQVGAMLSISASSAHTVIADALALRDRVPAAANALRDGRLTVRHANLLIRRTNLIDDNSDVAVKVNARLERRLSRGGSWSDVRMRDMIDHIVMVIDPDAVRRRRENAEDDRSFAVSNIEDGMAEIYAKVTAEDAAAVRDRIEQMAKEVCAHDPRNSQVRRSAAAVAAMLGRPVLDCLCDRDDCTARGRKVRDNVEAAAAATGVDLREVDICRRRTVIHVVINQTTLDGDDERPAHLEGYGLISADHARELAADDDAIIRPVQPPADIDVDAEIDDQQAAELLTEAMKATTYRPGRGLDDYVRIRDGYCVWPGCNKSARFGDIDHTDEFNHRDPRTGGLTVHTNTKCLCRFHHLVKTFTSWRDRQTSGTTTEFIAPDGTHYRGPAVTNVDLFPDLRPPDRSRPRTVERNHRKHYERTKNHQRFDPGDDPPPF